MRFGKRLEGRSYLLMSSRSPPGLFLIHVMLSVVKNPYRKSTAVDRDPSSRNALLRKTELEN